MTPAEGPWRLMEGPVASKPGRFRPTGSTNGHLRTLRSGRSTGSKLSTYQRMTSSSSIAPSCQIPYRKASSLAKSVDNEIASDRAMGDFVVYSFLNEATLASLLASRMPTLTH